jgi:hypothetical protein
LNGGDYAMRPAVLMSLDDVARAVGGMVYGSRVGISGVSTDSRAVATGDLFVAIVGERFDGHSYVEEAMRRGAVAALTAHRVEARLPIPQVVDGDTRIALGKLAADWRARFDMPLVALTGSNGKTTVKEMVASILVFACLERVGARDRRQPQQRHRHAAHAAEAAARASLRGDRDGDEPSRARSTTSRGSRRRTWPSSTTRSAPTSGSSAASMPSRAPRARSTRA